MTFYTDCIIFIDENTLEESEMEFSESEEYGDE